ncbi:hypothetical protein niasHT_020491 [Heterodera trifolii]|uniref:Uncharacterized protein n=1 Tax=Heterodera trifolii TaxID=157864 RepID=A0ABD2J9D6_9BILA
MLSLLNSPNCVNVWPRMFLLLLLPVFGVLSAVFPAQSRHFLHKRQTFHYPEELKEYAQNYHSGTRVIHGTLGRFAPHEWPAWYTRTMMKWNGESRMSPYSPNDVQYRTWRMNRILSEQP